MVYSSTFNILTQNASGNIEELVRIICKIADNILKDPLNVKYRTLLKSNATIKNKILSAKGGSECLKLMGFQENISSFIMPENVSINKIQEFKREISTWNELNMKSNGATAVVSNDNANNNENVIRRVKVSPATFTNSNSYLRQLETISQMVLQYENEALQERTKKLIPISELQIEAQSRLRTIQEYVKKNKLDDPNISIQDTLILALLKWFKEDFFEWVDSPPCDKCGCQTRFSHMSTDPKILVYTDRVELHKCKSCGEFTPFPRYNDVNILLETRRGRCGEWANTFTLLCISMGWDARFVKCEGDHVWTEVYSIAQQRWVHCDPCENICDTPLVYEAGWKKEMSYVIAYSAEEIQDVTWRYSSNHKNVLKKRNRCTESELLKAIFNIRSKLLKDASAKRKEYLTKRTLFELIELLAENKPGEEDQKGRTSGASAWRLARKEISETSEEHKFVWMVKTSDVIDDSVTVKYSASLNRYEYISGGNVIKEIRTWNGGCYGHCHIFRKEEKDWNMVYLARNEGEENGTISWKIDLSQTTKKLTDISLDFKMQTFENGIVNVTIQSDENTITLPKGETSITTNVFANCKELILNATLTGGKGDVAWQHSQLFRQSLKDTSEYPLCIVMKFS